MLFGAQKASRYYDYLVEMKSPDIIPLAVGLAVAHETRARLVQELPAFLTFQARRMPLQVGGDAQDELVVDYSAAADAVAQSFWFFCKKKRQKISMVQNKNVCLFINNSKTAGVIVVKLSGNLQNSIESVPIKFSRNRIKKNAN